MELSTVLTYAFIGLFVYILLKSNNSPENDGIKDRR